MTDHNAYDNPLITRYAGQAMIELWGPQRKHSIWRQLWIALAEAQHELGMTAEDGKSPRISAAQLVEMREHVNDIDFDRVAEHERRLRHDVMAHIHAFGEVAPLSKGIIHLGATSCFVTDNADLILIREGMRMVRDRLVGVIDALARFAEKWKDLPCLGYTHFQPAQLTTVGKRATLWCYDFVQDLREIDHRLATLRFRGAKGTTGTQASFLSLFRGDHAKVVQLDDLVASKMGFEKVEPVTGQTYSRKVDSLVVQALAGVCESAHKFATDMRLLAHEQEIDEPFAEQQVGSSAMAYKRNPMRSERICSLSRFVMGLSPMAAQTAANQWLERTLDDSAARRLYLPQCFLGTDAVLRLMTNVLNGLVVNPVVIERNVRRFLPYMVTEELLMAAVVKGADRQVIHEAIRRHCHAATADQKAGASEVTLAMRLQSDPKFEGIEIEALLDPRRHIGRAAEQVTEFVAGVVAPIRDHYPLLLNQSDLVEI